MDKIMDFTEEELCKLVPETAGIFFMGCPNCTGGMQENQLKGWSPEKPEEVRCSYCGMSYPNKKFPDDQFQEVVTPGGKTIKYPYYESNASYRYYFTAAVQYNKRTFCEEIILKLAQKYKETGNKSYARKSALMLYRFAEVWPDYCYHYDYPFKQKIWYNGQVSPEECKASYRTARWDWWGYLDLPGKLIDAYEIILAADIWDELNLEKRDNLKSRIEWFFTNNADHLISQKTELTNMHPYLWINVVKLGKLLGRLDYLHYLIPDMQRLLNKGFFADGTWHEGSPDYFIQTLKGILEVCRAYDDWTDPQDYIPSELDIRFDGEPIENKLPMISRAQHALKHLCFPNGERLTLHDSWGWEKYPYPEVPFDYSGNSFLLPSLGHACLAGGKGNSAGRIDFSFGGGYGHQHMDGLSIMLAAYGHEMLSDIGYTHTKYRSWTLSTACHNTVVIDHESQDSGSLSEPTDGSLSFMSVSSPFYHTVRAENTAAYSKKALRYERSLSRVNINDESFYVIDLFDVEGGTQHDYFLHGDCIAQQALSCSAGDKSLSFEFIDTLLPYGAEFNQPSGEHQANDCLIPGYAYGFLKDIGRASAADNSWIKAELVYTGKAVGEKTTVDKQGPGLAIHLYTGKGDTVYTGTNPSVRQGRYNDDILDEYQRTFVMLRKRPAENGASEKSSIFLSVMEPYYKTPLITNIVCLKKSGSSVLLRVDYNDTQDFIFYNLNVEEQLLHFERPLQLKGHSGFARFSGGKITAAWTASGIISYGGICLETEGAYTGALLESSDELNGGILTIADPNSKINPRCSDYILLRRDYLVFGMKVSKAEHDNGRTRLFVKDHPGFSYYCNENRSEDTVFPNRTYKGRHEVSWIPVAEWKNNQTSLCTE